MALLQTTKTLATIRLGLLSGGPLTLNESFSLVLGNGTNLFDDFGDPFAAGDLRFIDGPARLSVAVPEPASVCWLAGVTMLACCRKLQRQRLVSQNRSLSRHSISSLFS